MVTWVQLIRMNAAAATVRSNVLSSFPASMFQKRNIMDGKLTSENRGSLLTNSHESFSSSDRGIHMVEIS